MASPSSFRIEAEVLRGWLARVAPHQGVRSIGEVARDLDALAKRPADDGHSVVARYQLFTWVQSLQGGAGKLPLSAAADVKAVADDMNAYLVGKPAEPAPQKAPAPAQPTIDPPLRAPPYAAPPPVVYAASPPSASVGALRLLSETQIGDEAKRLLYAASRELRVVAPWKTGLDAMVPALLSLPPSVKVRVITRRPDPEEPAYHRALQDLQRRGADLVVSPNLHTRMLVQDEAALLLGAAGAPSPLPPWYRETALLTTDAPTVRAAREAFDRMLQEAKR